MPAIELVSISEANATTQPLAIPKPADLQNGDVLVLAIAAQTTSGLITPSGWTSSFSTQTSGSLAFKVWTKVVTNAATETVTHFFSHNGAMSGVPTRGVITAWRNVNTSTPIDVTSLRQGNAASTTVTAPSLTTVTKNALVLWFGAGNSTTVTTSVMPSGHDEIYNSTSAYHIAIGAMYKNPAGATGTAAGTLSESVTNVGGRVALRPLYPNDDPGPSTNTYSRTATSSAVISVVGSGTRTVTSSAVLYAVGPVQDTLYPVADAQTNSSLPDTNIGSQPVLEIRQSGPESRVFMKFDLPNMSAVSEAKLRLYVENGTTSGPGVHAVTSAWTESTITHNTMPTYGASLLTIPMSTPGVWVEADVTSIVPLFGTFDIALIGNSTNGADITSREGTNRPELVLTYIEAAPSIQRTVDTSACIYAEPDVRAIMSVNESRNDSGPFDVTLTGNAAVVGDAWRIRSGDSITANIAPIADVDNFDVSRTIYVVGDIHVGNSLQSRRDVVVDDVQTYMQGKWAQIVQTGDLTHNATSGEVTTGKAFMDALGSGWKIIGGNHDYYSSVTQAQFESTYNTTRNWYQDIGTDIRLIGLSNTGGSATTVVLDTTALNYLDARLSETSRNCIIFCHAPLYQSVLIDPIWPDSNGSEESNRHATPHATIMTILSENPNARGWFSGHTHSALTSPQLMMSYPLTGGGSILAVNVSSVAYPGKGSDSFDRPLSTCFVTVYDDRIEVRHRNHKTNGWHVVGGTDIYVYPFE